MRRYSKSEYKSLGGYRTFGIDLCIDIHIAWELGFIKGSLLNLIVRLLAIIFDADSLSINSFNNVIRSLYYDYGLLPYISSIVLLVVGGQMTMPSFCKIHAHAKC